MTDGYGLLVKLYPVAYRDAYGADLIATARELHGGRFSFREAASLAGNGIRQRVLASTQASPRATWQLAFRTAIWFSLMNWLTFRLVNSWLVIRNLGDFAGRERRRIGDVDVILTTFRETSDWIVGDGRTLFAITAACLALAAMALMHTSGPLPIALAAVAGGVSAFLVAPGLGDVVLYVSHIAVVAWLATTGDRRRVLAGSPLLGFVAVSLIFAVVLGPPRPGSGLLEYFWGTAEMVGLGFGLGLLTLAGLLLIAHDPRILPISAAIYGVFGIQVILRGVSGGEAIERLWIPGVFIQAAVIAALGVLASVWGNARVLRT